jgi:DNA repair exonuclease SbcCD ATPase subunit
MEYSLTLASLHFLQSELVSHKKRCEDRLCAVSEEHNAELARIDSKVRKALSLKDDTILQLQAKLQQAENKKIELERILSDLNSGLSAPLTSRSRY